VNFKETTDSECYIRTILAPFSSMN